MCGPLLLSSCFDGVAFAGCVPIKAPRRNRQCSLDPAARAILPPAPETSQKPAWKEVVDAAFALSARQNGGAPNRGRIRAVPQLGICSTAVILRADDGTNTMVSRRSKGQLRYLQVQPIWDVSGVQTGDGVTIREMKNNKSEWHKVGDEQNLLTALCDRNAYGWRAKPKTGSPLAQSPAETWPITLYAATVA